jgi:hypothetical protein
MRQAALAVGLAWACWWVLFEGAEAMGSHQFGQAIIFIVAMFGPLAVAWKWPAIGGGMLLAAGLAAIGMFTPVWIRRFDAAQFLLFFAMMPLPPLTAGVLLLLSRRRRPRAA